MNRQQLHPRGQRGFSMFLVIMAMFVTAMFVAAAFAAANGDLPVSGESKDRKGAYAAAEAGLNFYLNHLQQDNDYWTKCDSVPPPNASEPNPVNQQWDGGATDPRRWRTVPGSSSQYTIELLHTKPFTACNPNPQQQASLIDLATGTFKMRFTGRPYKNSRIRRSIVATFRRDGFLNFIYFTDYEDLDPTAVANATQRATLLANCLNKNRAARAGKGCVEIQFVTGDSINGPLHSNDDSVLVCGSPVFGRTDHVDSVEVGGAAPGSVANGGSCTNTPTINTATHTITPNATRLEMPQTNSSLEDIATYGGYVFAGKTIIRLKNGVMDVTTFDSGGNATTQTDVAWPNNGVIYVKNNGGCTAEYPTAAKYTEPVGCGNVYVSGTYSKSLTIAAANDVIIRPTSGALLNEMRMPATAPGSTDSDIIGTNDATLGLIANNFVRVGHKVTRNTDGSCVGNFNTTHEPQINDIRIDAAILSLQHSFIADNYECGRTGTLTVNGAIAQKYRGAVGTGSGASPSTGFLKNYWYDDRFRYRSPPYFLNPVDSAWDVIRSHEQVPAR